VVTANLDDVTPPDLFFAKDARVTLRAANADLAEAPLAALYAHREGAAWRRAESSSCTTSLDESACELDATYARNYPAGEHVADARLAIEEANKRRWAAAEDRLGEAGPRRRRSGPRRSRRPQIERTRTDGKNFARRRRSSRSLV
jgi:hypothetical protein